MRIFISVDMEGIAGAVSWHQLLREGFEYERAREWLTAEVNAACEAAYETGVSEIVIADSHYEGLNLIIDRLPEDVEIVRHWPRPLNMMQGVEDGHFDGAILLGYHGGAHIVDAGLAHTMFFTIKELRLNGRSFSETELSAATAGHFGVPVIMVSGDDIYVDNARKNLGEVETVVTRRSYGIFSGKMITPAKSRTLIRETVARAIGRIGDFEPFVVDSPIEVEFELGNHALVEMLCYLKEVERTDAHTFRMHADNIVDVSRFMAFLGSILSQGWAAFTPGGRK